MSQPTICETSEHGEADFIITTLASGDTKFYCVGCFVQFATAVADTILQAMTPEGTPVDEETDAASERQGGPKRAPRPRPKRHLAVHREVDPPPTVAASEEEAEAG